MIVRCAYNQKESNYWPPIHQSLVPVPLCDCRTLLNSPLVYVKYTCYVQTCYYVQCSSVSLQCDYFPINEPHHEKNMLFAIGKNKGTDQLHSNRAADQYLCFCYIDSRFLYFLNPKFQASNHPLWLHSPVCVRPCWKSQ